MYYMSLEDDQPKKNQKNQKNPQNLQLMPL